MGTWVILPAQLTLFPLAWFPQLSWVPTLLWPDSQLCNGLHLGRLCILLIAFLLLWSRPHTVRCLLLTILCDLWRLLVGGRPHRMLPKLCLHTLDWPLIWWPYRLEAEGVLREFQCHHCSVRSKTMEPYIDILDLPVGFVGGSLMSFHQWPDYGN